MKRSEVNRIILEGKDFIRRMNFQLPPFASWSPDRWNDKAHEYDEIRENMLGWDITDFGSGEFMRIGLLLFTLRNGNISRPEYDKPYAEKLLIVREGQITPCHYHWNKMEDIINRGGGNLLLELYNADEDEEPAATPVSVHTDGHRYEAPAGSVIRLSPGESITLPQRLYHRFWAEEGRGRVLLGEVSQVNDDRSDNRFLEPVGRFPAIEEDEEPLFLLCNEYPPAE